MMNTNQALLFSGVVLAGVAGLGLSEDKSPPPGARLRFTSPQATQAPAPGRSGKAAADFPVICHIEQRDRTITVKAGPEWPVYSVKAADGKLLCDNLSIEQLSAQAPGLGEFLRTAVVGAPGAKADARLRINFASMVRDSQGR